MIGRATDIVFKAVEALLAFMLLAMVLMVLTNVILRYGFHRGIMSSEELSRVLLVWLTFIGAVLATREGTHLSVDSLIRSVSRGVAGALVFVGELAVLGCCVLLFFGTWTQHEITASSVSLVTGISLIWIFGVAYVTSVGIGLLTLAKLFRIISGKATDFDLFVKAAEDDVPTSLKEPAAVPGQAGL